MREPAEIVDELERDGELPVGSEARFFGYGVIMNGVGSLLPDRAWRSPAVLAPMARVAGAVLRAAGGLVAGPGDRGLSSRL